MLQRSPCASLAFVLMFTFAPPQQALAQSETAGFHVVPGHVGREWGPRTIPDGQGGALVSFKSEPGLHYLARIGPSGAPEPGWGASGFGGINVVDYNPQVPVSFAMADPGAAWVISDAGGGAARLLHKIDGGGLAD